MLTDIVFSGLVIDDEIDEHELSSYKWFRKFIFSFFKENLGGDARFGTVCVPRQAR